MPTPLFEKGHARVGGRAPGQRNRNTTLLKDALLLAGSVAGDTLVTREIIERAQAESAEKDSEQVAGELQRAVEEHGSLVGYLSWLALEHPNVFGPLLGKVLPLQIKVDSHKDIVYRTVEEIQREIDDLKLPMDRLAPLLLNTRSANPMRENSDSERGK